MLTRGAGRRRCHVKSFPDRRCRTAKDPRVPRLLKLAFALGAYTCALSPVAATESTPGGELAVLPPAEYVAQRSPELVPAPAPEAGGLTLAAVEELALSANPSLAEAEARVRAARGQWLQAGLPPNPTIGYLATEIGNEGEAGQQGMVFGQEIIRGRKLALSRAVESREVMRLEQRLAAQTQRVLTDVRIAFYNAYLAQQRVDLSNKLQDVGEQSQAAAKSLFEAAEGRSTDLLQAEIEARRATADLAQAESGVRAAWRRLAIAIGQPELAMQPLVADVQALRWADSWEETRDRLFSESPEMAEALARVEKARCALARACAEPIPDVTAEASVLYDHATQDTVAGAQVTLPLPLWNRNQGGIAKARASLLAAQLRLETVQLRLEQRLAVEYQRYETSLIRVEALEGDILRRAQQSIDVATQGYAAGELGFLDFLTVQRTYFQANLEYLTALGQLNESVQMLAGLLLAGSYQQAELSPP
jgi:cobalt-zinc-cadmium efflux system outer membrane protein